MMADLSSETEEAVTDRSAVAAEMAEVSEMMATAEMAEIDVTAEMVAMTGTTEMD